MKWVLLVLVSLAACAQEPLLGSWYVSVVSPSGEVGRPDPKPWVFEEGTVRCGQLWTGKWHKKSERVYTVQIISGNGQTDIFELILDSRRWFTCIKGVEAYRIGRR